MVLSRWWDLAIAGCVLVVAVILWLSAPTPAQAIAVTAATLLLVAGWIAAGRRAYRGDARAISFTLVLVVVAGTLVSAQPILAIFQCIAYPAVWLLARSNSRAVLANIAVAGAVAIGFCISVGTAPADLAQTAVTMTLSLGGSLAIGFWISSIAHLSEERRVLLDTLTVAQDELATLHRDAGVTSERERLARELHDTIAQSLAGLVLLGQRSRRELAAGTLGDPTLELIESGAREALAETRALVAGSAPVELSAGIVAALTRLGERFSRETGIEVTSTASVDPAAALGRDSEVVLLRCAQEGLANVRKHAGATTARFELTVDSEAATMRVVDDGQGFDPDAASEGFGLSGLRARLALVGGTISVDGAAGATTLTARLPLVVVSA